MGFFSQPKVVVLKESSNAKEYLQQLEELKVNQAHRRRLIFWFLLRKSIL